MIDRPLDLLDFITTLLRENPWQQETDLNRLRLMAGGFQKCLSQIRRWISRLEAEQRQSQPSGEIQARRAILKPSPKPTLKRVKPVIKPNKPGIKKRKEE